MSEEKKKIELKEEKLEKVTGGDLSLYTQVGKFSFLTKDNYEVESVETNVYRCDTKEEFDVSYIEDVLSSVSRIVSTVYHFIGRDNPTHWFVFTADENHTVCNEVVKYPYNL